MTKLLKIKLLFALIMMGLVSTMTLSSCSNDDEPTIGSRYSKVELKDNGGFYVVTLESKGALGTNEIEFTIPVVDNGKELDLSTPGPWKITGTSINADGSHEHLDAGSKLKFTKKGDNTIELSYKLSQTIDGRTTKLDGSYSGSATIK